jgi:hypothetical protein
MKAGISYPFRVRFEVSHRSEFSPFLERESTRHLKMVTGTSEVIARSFLVVWPFYGIARFPKNAKLDHI